MTFNTRPGVLAVTRLLLAALLFTGIAAQAETPPKAAIAAAHPLATAAGLEILDAGGNAFDAAIAVAATLAVVEPYASGLGGGGFFLLHDERSGKDVVVDAREKAPLAAVPEMYLNNKGELVQDWAINGPLAAAIPGLPAALVHLAARYGAKSLAEDLAPAIRAARDGFAVDERYRQMARQRLEVLRRSSESSQTFLIKGDVPAPGSVIRQPELGDTLDALARGGHEGFYEGENGQRIADAVAEAGGIWTAEDLAKYRVVEREPIVAEFRGARIVTLPPPSAGGVALVSMLNQLAALELRDERGAARDQLLIEVMRRAFRDRALYLGDPDFVQVPVGELVSMTHARQLAATIVRGKVTPSSTLGQEAAPPPQGDHTSHFSILDRGGNRVAATLSINLPFGSGFSVPGTGILLNNEMDDFTTAPGTANAYGLTGSDANAIAPGKRPLSSMAPAFVDYGDRVAILGTPGGSRIPGMVALAILGLLDGDEPAKIVARERFHHQYLPDVVEAEAEYFGGSSARELRKMGYALKSTGRNYGNMQLLVWDKASGRISAVSDPRGVGQATSR